MILLQQIEEINERNNTVWCHIALALDNNSLLYIRHDYLSSDGVGNGAKAWRLLQQRYSNVEKPTVVSLVRQISRLQLDENEKLSEYFIQAQELMSRLTEAGEKISETLFNALVVNGLYQRNMKTSSYKKVSILQQISQNYEHAYKILMIADSKETKQKKGVQQLCILIYQVEIKVQACQRETVLCADILVILPSNVAKEVQLIAHSAYCSKCKKRGHLPKACRSRPDKTVTKERDPFASYSQCMNSGTKISSNAGKLNLIIDTGCIDHIVTQKELFENLQPCMQRQKC